MDGHDVGKSRLAADALQQNACSNRAHFIQWLANCGQAGVVESSSLDVVKTHNRDVFRNPQSLVHERPDRPDGSNVVETDERGEIDPTAKQLIGRPKTQLGRGDAELDRKSVV